MRRIAIAAAWLIGATVPLLMAAVFLFGCCVLPFHRVVHRLMPLCNMAADVLRGQHAADHPQQAPAREKQEPLKRVALELAHGSRVTPAIALHAVTPSDRTAYRSFISLGAMRCDRDVGLHLLVATLLI